MDLFWFALSVVLILISYLLPDGSSNADDDPYQQAGAASTVPATAEPRTRKGGAPCMISR